MKASAEKSSTTSSASAAKAVPQPFFAKSADEDQFFPPVTQSAAPVLQARLQAGQHGDRYEREADWMAEKVVWPTDQVWKNYCPPENREKIQFKPLAASVTPFAPGELETEKFSQQAKNLPESTPSRMEIEPRLDEKEGPLQKQEEREEPAQAKSLGHGSLQVLPSIEKSIRSHRGLGSPVPDTVLTTMEKGFGADFNKVRLHTGSQAADLSKNLNSQAFTVRNDIFFAQDKYNPATTEGKLLLAHELTHTLQQGASRPLSVTTQEEWAQPAYDLTNYMQTRRIEPSQKSVKQEKPETLVPETAKPTAEIPALPPGQQKLSSKMESAAPAVMEKPEVPTSPEISSTVATPSKTLASFQEDPDFHRATQQVRIEAKKQKIMHPTATAQKKRKEAENASALEENVQIEQSARENNIVGMEKQAEEQNSKRFSADEFIKKFHELVEKQKKPKTESEVKGFAQKPPIEGFPKDISDGLAQKQNEVTGPLQKKATLDPTGGVVEKAKIRIPDPTYPPAPKPVGPKLAIPKPKTAAEISTQSQNDRLDGAMQENRLSDEQLAESREPSFLKALNFKQEAKKKVAEAPGNYRQREDEILKKAEVDINTSLSTKLTGISKIRHKTGGKTFGSQKDTESKTEKRQGEIKKDIDNIYKKTVEDVTDILKGMAEKVKEDFANSLETQKHNFNDNVTNSLENYYTTGKKIKHFLLGEPKVVVNEDGSTRSLTPEDYDPYPFELRSGIEWINPEVYKIFVREKDKFIAAMDGALENIAKNVELGLTMAHLRIQLGQVAIDVYKAGLKGDERVFAEALEQEVKMKFENLESTIDNTRDELLQTMADQYNENLKDLETKFKEINDELKKTWVDRAVDFIEAVGKTIYQLADLLLSILTRIAAIVWDIIKHPIRFFETLVRGLIKGISTFIDDIGTYLEEAFWSWVTGATAAKGIRLGPGSAVEKLFGLVVQVLSISPDDLKKMAEKVFGPEVVGLVEKGLAMGQAVIAGAQKILEPAIILLRDGVGAFWSYLKETIGGMIDGIFAKIKETVFFEFVKKGLKYIAGFFVPGGGFVKVVKALFAAVEFLVNNMDKIRTVVDSILGSFEKAIRGDDSGVAARVLQGLKIGVVLALDFLARLLGLDTILEKVHKFFHDLRKPILEGIEWVMRKIRTALEKIGFFKWLDSLKKAGTKVLQAGLPKDPNERVKLAGRAAVTTVRVLKGFITFPILAKALNVIKMRYGLTSIEPHMHSGTWWVRLSINPKDDVDTGKSIKADISFLTGPRATFRNTANNINSLCKQGTTQKAFKADPTQMAVLTAAKTKIDEGLDNNKQPERDFLKYRDGVKEDEDPPTLKPEELKELFDSLVKAATEIFEKLRDFVKTPEEHSKEIEELRKQIAGARDRATKVLAAPEVKAILALSIYEGLKNDLNKGLSDLEARISADTATPKTLEALRADWHVANTLNQEANRANSIANIANAIKDPIKSIDSIITNTTEAGRRAANIGDRSSEAAAINEAKTGEQTKGTWHGPKCKMDSTGLAKEIKKLGDLRPLTSDPKVLSQIDAAIDRAKERKTGLDSGWKAWKASPYYHLAPFSGEE